MLLRGLSRTAGAVTARHSSLCRRSLLATIIHSRSVTSAPSAGEVSQASAETARAHARQPIGSQENSKSKNGASARTATQSNSAGVVSTSSGAATEDQESEYGNASSGENDSDGDSDSESDSDSDPEEKRRRPTHRDHDPPSLVLISPKALQRGQAVRVETLRFGHRGATVRLVDSDTYGTITREQLNFYQHHRNARLVPGEVVEGVVEGLREDGRFRLQIHNAFNNRINQIRSTIIKKLQDAPNQSLPIGPRSSTDAIRKVFPELDRVDFEIGLELLGRRRKIEKSDQSVSLSRTFFPCAPGGEYAIDPLTLSPRDLRDYRTIHVLGFPPHAYPSDFANFVYGLIGRNLVTQIRMRSKTVKGETNTPSDAAKGSGSHNRDNGSGHNNDSGYTVIDDSGDDRKYTIAHDNEVIIAFIELNTNSNEVIMDAMTKLRRELFMGRRLAPKRCGIMRNSTPDETLTGAVKTNVTKTFFDRPAAVSATTSASTKGVNSSLPHSSDAAVAHSKRTAMVSSQVEDAQETPHVVGGIAHLKSFGLPHRDRTGRLPARHHSSVASSSDSTSPSVLEEKTPTVRRAPRQGTIKDSHKERTLFMRNMPYSLSADLLKKHLDEAIGDATAIKEVRLVLDSATKIPRFAFVDFVDAEVAQRVLKMSSVMVLDRKVYFRPSE